MKDKYRLKTDPKAFFYPGQWTKLYNKLLDKQKLYFKIAINTGGRINEIKHLRRKDIDFERNNLTFYITKVKAKKNETRPVPRKIPISTEFTDWLKRYCNSNKIKDGDYFKIPSTVGINKAIKIRCKEIGIEEWQDFSSHNIRKTHGNWLKSIGVDGFEICNRLGHDYNTFIRDYSSPDLFKEKDKILIKEIIGDLYRQMRKE